MQKVGEPREVWKKWYGWAKGGVEVKGESWGCVASERLCLCTRRRKKKVGAISDAQRVTAGSARQSRLGA